MSHAFDDFRKLIRDLNRNYSAESPNVRYICSLVAELAYYHVPEFEIDDKKRAMMIPCEGYRQIIKEGKSTNVVEYLESQEYEKPFEVVDRGIVAIGIPVDNLLFIGFRGTKFLFDWRVNLKARLIEIGSCNRFKYPLFSFVAATGGRAHQGFAEEAVRISAKIKNNIPKNIDHIFLAGHSLGGAVAALSEAFIRSDDNITTCIFGSPRYCDVSAYYFSRFPRPTQIQRREDIVPLLPPRRLGYADHPYQLSTTGDSVHGSGNDPSKPHFLWRLAPFVAKKLEPHKIELYRQELGSTSDSELFDKQLVPLEELYKKHIKAK